MSVCAAGQVSSSSTLNHKLSQTNLSQLIMYRSIARVGRSTGVGLRIGRNALGTTGLSGQLQLARLSSGGPESPEELEKKYLVPTYNATGIRAKEGLVFERGSGSYVFDESGNRFLDFTAGIAVNALGHSDADWVTAVTEQLQKIVHVSNLYHTRPALDLAKELVDRSGFDRVFFCNSGTEANEAAIKFSRKYQLRRMQNQSKAPTKVDFACQRGKDSVGCQTNGGTCACWPQSTKLPPSDGGFNTGMVSFQSGFHGRTGFALSATHKPAIRQPFAPLVPDCTFLPYNDAEAAARIRDIKPGTVIVEPHAGEGGVIAGTPAFLEAVEQSAKEAEAVLIADEVQCGLGRLGTLFAHEAYDMQPDIMTLAKPLAGGLPIGAVLVKEHIANAIDPGDHGTTFGGNPLVCAAALHVLRRIDTPEFLGNARSVGRAIKSKALDLQRRFPQVISEVRAPVTGGPFVGLQLSVSPAGLVKQCVDDGLLIITAGTSTVRLCPPLTMSVEEAEAGMNMLERAMETVFAPGRVEQ